MALTGRTCELTVQKINNGLLYGVTGDTKPTNYANNTLFFEQDTGSTYRITGGTWTKIAGSNVTETLTNKIYNTHDNVIPYGVMGSHLNKTNKRFSWMYITAGGAQFVLGGFAGVASSSGTIGGTPPAWSPSILGGFPWPFVTGAVSGNQARYQWLASTRWADGPHARLNFKLSSTTSIRLFIGWTSVTGSFPTTDTFFATTTSGIGVGKTSASSNMQVFSNDGATHFTATTPSPTLTATDLLSPVTLEFWVDPTADTFNLTWDGGTTVQSWSQASIFAPADNDLLGFVLDVGTATSATRTLTLYHGDGENT
jgi:hypothetical protein